MKLIQQEIYKIPTEKKERKKEKNRQPSTPIRNLLATPLCRSFSF